MKDSEESRSIAQFFDTFSEHQNEVLCVCVCVCVVCVYYIMRSVLYILNLGCLGIARNRVYYG
jgi:hypothetical protein